MKDEKIISDNASDNTSDTADTVSEVNDAPVTETVIKTHKKFAEKSGSKEKKKKLDIIPIIVCLFCSILIWYYVMQVDSPDYQEVFYDVDVALTNTAMLENERGLYVYSGYGHTVNVTVSGKKSVISKYTSDDIKVVADLSGIETSGEHQTELSVTLPAGLSLVKPDYNTVNVYVDEKATVDLVVDTKVTGATYSGEYEYGDLVPEVSVVVAHGPKSEIEKLDRAVVSVDLSSIGVIRESTMSVCRISAVNKDGEVVTNPYINLSRSEIRVTLPVYTYKDLPIKVAFTNGLLNSTNSKIKIKPETVRVKGDPAILDRYSEITVAKIDEKTLVADTVSIYELEANDDFTYVDSSSVEVSIQHVGTTTKTYSVTNINIKEGKNNCSLIDESVDVTLRGTPKQLDEITADNISLEIDASSYSNDYSGTARVLATVKITGENTKGVYELNSYSVQIKVN